MLNSVLYVLYLVILEDYIIFQVHTIEFFQEHIHFQHSLTTPVLVKISACTLFVYDLY